MRVRKDGRAPGLYGDEACTRPVTDADLEAVRSDLRFLPAPAKGKPAESVVAMNLGQRPD